MPEQLTSARNAAPRRAAGIDRETVLRVVHEFYGLVRADATLGPIFNSRIAGRRLPAHLAAMVDFWCAVLLLTGSYKGKPVQAHAQLPLKDHHYRRWLALFHGVVTRHCTPEGAALFMARAARIADSLRMADQLEKREEALSLTAQPEEHAL